MTRGAPAPAAALELGRCDEVRAEVLVRAEPGPDGAGATITGILTGPYRGRDTTLPATARLQPTGTAGLARAILTEPAYWTPELPNRYRLEAEVAGAGGPAVAIDRLVGLRRLGVRGRSLWLDGRRWVPRAVIAEGVADIDACRPETLAALVADPDEATLARADEIGVAILATVSGGAASPAAVADRIAGWSAHPAAAVVILPPDLPAARVAEVAAAARGRTGTLLLAATVAGAGPPPATVPPGIDALVVVLEAGAVPHGAWREGATVPLVARRREEATPAAGRRPCDALQAALAAWATASGPGDRAWDWAGYVVS